MSFEVTMPALSPTMEKGNLTRWLVREGDTVRAGDVLAEIETDKASMEFEAIGDGVVSRIMVAAGTDDVPIGTVMALIGDAAVGATTRGTDAAQEASSATTTAAPGAAPPPPASPAAPAVVPHTPPTEILDTKPSAPPPAPVAIRASPLARRIAGVTGIDLGQVRGSGRSGKILRIDVMPDQAAAATDVLVPAQAAPAAAVHPPPTGVPHETVKLSTMRRTIAVRLTEAKQTVPHFYLNVDVRLDALLALRRDLNATGVTGGLKLSVNDFLIKAMAIALEQTPDANVQFGGDRLYRFKRADVSMAVAIPSGLVTPVILDAANKRLSRLAAEARDLAARARNGQLAPQEYQGGTASISNLGMFGMTSITPILNPPQALILGIGAGEEKPWIKDGAIGIATVMTVTGSFDHRAIDGAVGAEFMRGFKKLVEQPLDILT